MLRTGTKLLTGASAAAIILMISSPALAQDAAAATEQEDNDIVVTGTRASLQDALNIKRNASNVVDVITAEDIGELPDGNVAESLQRISGVQIERVQGAGARLRIRGLSALTLINGRELVGQAEPTSDGGNNRQFNFRNLASDFFETLEVSKSIRADQIEGALGGVVNLVTRKPTDLKEPLIAATILGNYADRAKDYGGSASLTVGDKFADDTIGFIASVVYDKSAVREDVFMVRGGFGAFDTGAATGFNFDADPALNEALKPVDIRFLIEDQKIERIGANAAVNWAPSENFDVRLDGTFLRLDNDWRRYFFRTLFDPTFLPGSLTLSDQGAITAGTFTNQRVQPDGRNYPERQTTFAGGLNANWRTGPVTLSYDTNFSKSTRRRVEQFLRFQGFDRATVKFDLNAANDLPSIALTNAAGGPFDITTPTGYFTELNFDRMFDGFQKKWEHKFDAKIEIDGSHVKAVNVGGRAAFTDAQDVLTQAFPQNPTPDNPAFFDTTTGRRRNVGEAPVSQFLSQSPGSLFNGFSGNIPRFWIGGQIGDIGINDPSENFTTSLNLRRDGFRLIPENFSAFEENTYAGYVSVDLAGELFSIPYAANVGVRVVNTRFASTGFVVSTTPSQLTIKSDYTDVLPAANLKLDVLDDLVVRLAAAKSLERAPFGNLIAGFNVDRSSGTARGGNPTLEPFRATQFDISLEYYPNKDGALALSGFHKKAQNFITTTTQVGQIPGLLRLDGGADFLITQPVNGGDATIKGFEVSAQQALTFLPGILSGLGFVANYTFTDVKTAQGDPFPLLSKHAYNLIAYYDRGDFDFRVAYSWRSRFNSFAEGGNAAQGFGLYEYTAAEGFLDASFSYDVTAAVKLRVEAFNLSKTLQRRYLETPANLRNLFVQDRRFAVGLRATF